MTESEIFNVARKLPGGDIDAYLERACGGDQEMKQRVVELLRANDETDRTADANVTRDLPSVSADNAGPFESEPALTIDSDSHVSPPPEADSIRPGDRIGPFTLLQPLGRGGMGEVWMAEQSEPVKRRVALKIIKAGIGSKEVLARFEAERQALALMNHPNIARILDAGATPDGQPYFAMELVQGKPLTTYCDENCLSVDERLQLFTSVCSGVQHAHQKGIIHRDLKPGNIIVGMVDGKPVPKVIDFGLAKAMESALRLTDQSLFTGIGQILGTLKYMSPEQASLDTVDIDTRTDIYALGVILYELLTGSTPLDNSSVKGQAALKVLEFIRDREPVKPSSKLGSSTAEQVSTITGQRKTDSVRLNRVLAGDLDWIVMKALEKDRTRRYESASGFAADIQRYLDNEPVEARPPSLNYRARKFIRKNRVGVIAASLVAVAIAAGLLGTTLAMFRAFRAEANAVEARDDAKSKQIEAETARNDAKAQLVRAEAREQEAIDAVRRFGDSVANNLELKNNPALESLRKTLLQEPLAFFQSLRTRLESDQSTTPESLARLANAASDLGILTYEIGDKQDSLRAHEQALAIQERLVRENPTVNGYQNDLARSQLAIGALLSLTGKPDEALKAYEQAVTIEEALARENPTVTRFQGELAKGYHNIGLLLSETGRPNDAFKAYKMALAIHERLARENPTVLDFHRDLARSYNSVGALLRSTGKPDEALKVCEQALAIENELAHTNPTVMEFQSALARSHNSIGLLFSDTGKPDEALKAYKMALAIQERLARENPTVSQFQSALAGSHYNIGVFYSDTGKPDEALKSYVQALAIRERLAREHPTVTEYLSNSATSHNSLGSLLRRTGKPDGAIKSYEQALAIRERLAHENPTVPEFQRDLMSSQHDIGILLYETGKPDEALKSFEQALAIQERLARENPTIPGFLSDLASNHNNIGSLLLGTGRTDEALKSFEQALAIREGLARENPTVPGLLSDLASSYNSMGILLRNAGKADEALKFYEQALAIRERLARENPTVLSYEISLGGMLNNIATLDLDAERFDDARLRLEKAIACQKSVLRKNAGSPTARQFLQNHLNNLKRAAIGLEDESLRQKAEQGLAELAISDPANERFEQQLNEFIAYKDMADSKELLSLAQYAYDTIRFELATQLYAKALDKEPLLMEDRRQQVAYNAACCAILASARKMSDGSTLSDDEEKKLRDQALAWLQGELIRWDKTLEEQPDQKTIVLATLRHWQQDADLKGIMDDNALQQLSADERAAWEDLWEQVRNKTLALSGDSEADDKLQ